MNIYIVSPIDTDAINVLSQQHNVVNLTNKSEIEVKSQLQDCHVVVFRSGISISADLMDQAPNLKLLIRAGSGIDNIDMAYVHDRGLDLVRIPQPGAQAVAELSFAFMLALSRNLFRADRSMREGRWIKYELDGYLLKNKTLGIIGLGNIGSRVAAMGLALGMKAIGCVEHPTEDRVQQYSARNIHVLNFDQVVSKADYLSIHVPLKDSTRDLVDAEVLSNMKTGSYLINSARGGIVDEMALLRELKDGSRLRGAALDVHRVEGEGKFSPLIDLPNVILTPHVGAMAIDAQREIGQRIIDSINEFEAKQSNNSTKKGKIGTQRRNVSVIPEVGND